jgi:glycosyltransferase involved in cell wall biosynthesis
VPASGVPVISVVIPAWNAARWIGAAVVSVAGQRDVTVEIVLVDDGSEDDTVALARSVAGVPITVIHQDHLGPSRARTAGTAAAQGAFVQYLDADDELAEGTLARRLAALEAGGADVAYCDWVRWEPDAAGVFRETEVVAERLGDRPDVDLFTRRWWPPGALLYRRAIVDRLGPWREDLPIVQDARFALDAAVAGARFVHVPGVGLRYRQMPGSLSRRDPQAFLLDRLRNARTAEAEWRAAGTLDDARRRALVEVYGGLARGLFTSDRARFHEVYAHLLTLDPAFRPSRPASLRRLSAVIGYPAAEHVAAAWRRAKRLVHGRKAAATTTDPAAFS